MPVSFLLIRRSFDLVLYADSILDSPPVVCYTLLMSAQMSPINNYIATDTGMLAARERVLDEKFLNNPVVAAQRIQREYIKLCLKNPEILLPSTLVL